ncbi:MAG: hypothetical protein CME55_08275 [Halieaceae bacterium]|nr:hypothetical protein [Halieaceae bacterium]
MTNIGNVPGVNPGLANLGNEPQATPANTPGANVALDGFDVTGQGIERVLVDLGIAASDPNFSLDRYPASARAELSSISSALSSGDTDQVQSQFANFIRSNNVHQYQDVNALVQQVLRESYMQNTEDLRHYAEKVRSFNEQKSLIRDYLSELRQHSTSSREAAIAGGTTGDDLETAGLSGGFSFQTSGDNAAAAQALGLTDGLEGATTIQGLDDLIAKWEDKLNTIGDDAQLANVDLQNMLQKQQQTLQMMSNISKALHDTAMAIIRKIGG